jgi:hypothetical protein
MTSSSIGKLKRAVEDLEAFFELAGEGEDVTKDIQQELKRLDTELAASKPPPC